ncbi:MAG: DUF4269 domain-containing protein [Cellulophaga sp.]|uniref:DUF4269 domain-containing protein n=1 Tax=Cellulophaga sp. TaxID=1972202 RepID=UPI003265F94F
MAINFKNIAYLKHGNQRQRLAFSELNKYKILEKLKKYNPILTGTIPIDIDIAESDLDIICECKNNAEFLAYLQQEFSTYKNFKVYTTLQNNITATIAEFRTEHFLFEIFGQDIPTTKQNAYLHMVIEHQILQEKGVDFKQQIKELKNSGIKTEPAFAKLLGLKGDPYAALLELKDKIH